MSNDNLGATLVSDLSEEVDLTHGVGDTLLSELDNLDEIAHSVGDTLVSEIEDNTDEYLSHFGVKGMKWGKTRKRGPDGRVAGKASPTPHDGLQPDPNSEQVSVLVRGNQIVGTVGGRGIKPHDDAVNAKVIKQKISGSGLTAVSNKELQDYVTRVNLEQNYARLNPKTASRGEQFARSAGTGTAKFVGGVAKDVARETLKTAIKTGIDTAIKK